MTRIERFEDLKAWKDARELTRQIYDVSDRGQFARDFALKDQIRRAAVSIMSNIAEGFESRTTRLFIDFLGRAKASAGEVRSQLYIALDRNYINDNEFNTLKEQAEELSKQIRGFSAYLDSVKTTHQVRENDHPETSWEPDKSSEQQPDA